MLVPAILVPTVHLTQPVSMSELVTAATAAPVATAKCRVAD